MKLRRCKSLKAWATNKKLLVTKALGSFTKQTIWCGDGQGKNKSQQVRTPDGCFSVYVGSQRQRFVVKTELANHPLFKMLLEDAESEHGFNSQGPIWLPCEVDLFYKVLAEMESTQEEEEEDPKATPGCNFTKRYNSVKLISSPYYSCSSISNIDDESTYVGYRLLTPSRMLKMNHFY